MDLIRIKLLSALLSNAHDLPDTDDVVSVTSVKDLSIRRPGERDRGGLLARDSLEVNLLLESALLQVVDLDARSSSSGNPETARREGKVEDLISTREGVRVGNGLDVPDEDIALLASGGAERSIRSKSGGVNVVLVADEVGSKLSLSDVPSLWKWLVSFFNKNNTLLIMSRRSMLCKWIRDLGGNKCLIDALGSSKCNNITSIPKPPLSKNQKRLLLTFTTLS